MIRRSRISVRPNIARPGGRGLPGSQEGQHGQGAAAVDTTHAAGTEGKGPDCAAVTDPSQRVELSAKPEARLNTSLDTSPGEKNPPNLGEEDQNGGAPNSSTLSSSMLQRRKRLSALPNLSKPRITPAPRTPKSPLLKSAPPPIPAESPDPVPEEQAAKGSGTEQGVASSALGSPDVGSPDMVVLGDQTTSPDHTEPVSPVASTTYCSAPPSEKNEKEIKKSSSRQSVSLESKASSCQPVQSEPVLSCGKLSPGSESPLPGPSMEHRPLKLVPALEDRRRIAKARKLKEMMRLQNRKEKSQRKSKPQDYDFNSPLDHGKMTMRDLIYYLPDTNPMKSAIVEEQKQDEQFSPPFPSQESLPTKAEMNEEEYDDDDDDSMKDDEDLLVPKVKVAEDGSLIIDEESLTVRVKRPQGPCIVEGNDPVFERGSTTTYMSFRNLNHTKPWSDKETDMFYLALSMVGSDFSMMGQLFPHRNRKEVKNKFKREEKTNSWRIDKAFREKRPFDMDFFSTLLELVLTADQKKRDKPKGSSGEKPKRKRKGKKAPVKGANDGEPDSDVAEGDFDTAEKENEDCSNVAEAKDSKKATRKSVKKSEGDEQGEEKPNSTKNQEEKVKPKRREKMADGKKASVKRASEDQATQDGEADSDVAEGGLETAEEENEGFSNVAQAKDTKKGTRKKRKLVKNKEGEEQEQEKHDSTENQECEVKPKRRKKMANGKKASVKEASEDQATQDGGADGGVAEGDLETAEKENEDCCKDSTKGTRKKRKRLKKSEEEEQAEKDPDSAEEPVVKVKKKRQKKMANDNKAELKGADQDVEVADAVADSTNATKAARKRLKHMKKGKEVGEQEGEEQNTETPDDGAIFVNVTENEVASVQSDAEEAEGLETTGSTVEGQLAESVRVTRAEAQPSLMRGALTENILDSEAKTLDSSRREEEEGQEDSVSLLEISDCSAVLRGVFPLDGSTFRFIDEEGAEGNQQGAPGVWPTDGQQLMNNSRVEVQESPPSAPPPPEATFPKGHDQQPIMELRPSARKHPEKPPSSKLKMGYRGEEEAHDEGCWEDKEMDEEPEMEEQEEEQGSPTHSGILSQEQMVSSGLHSLELLSNELEIPMGVSDAPGPGVSAGAQCSMPECKGAEDECVELSEDHLNLLVDVMQTLSPHLVGGMQAEQDDEVARTLLTLSNPDLQTPEIVSAQEPSSPAPVKEKKPGSELADQLQSCSEPPQSEVSDFPVAAAPTNENETLLVEEPVRSEQGESIATGRNVMRSSEPLRSDPSVQISSPLGRRSRFPKPRPNLGLATRAPRIHLRGTTATPCPDPVTSAAPPTAGIESPTPPVEERSDQKCVANKEGTPIQNEGETSDLEKLPEPGALSTQNETVSSESLAQSVPLVRRCRFLKPRPNLGRSTCAPHPAPYRTPLNPKPVTDSSYTPLVESSTLTPVQETPTCSSSDPSAEVIDLGGLIRGSTEALDTEGESPAVEMEVASIGFRAPLGPSKPCPGPPFTDLAPGTGEEGTAEGTPASVDILAVSALNQKELVPADNDASSSAGESRQAAAIEAPSVCFDGDSSAFATKECMEGLSWADGGEEEPTFILTLYAIPSPEMGEHQTSPEETGLAPESLISPLTTVDPQSGPLPAVSEPLNCESLSVETTEAGSGCGFIPVCEGQEEGPSQCWASLHEQRPRTAPSQSAGETSLTCVMKKDAEDLAGLFERDHSSHMFDPVAKSHDPVAGSHDPIPKFHDPVAESHNPEEAGTDRTTMRDAPFREKKKPHARTRRGKLQMMPCVTLRKLRSSVRDEQGLLPVEAEQPGPSHTYHGPAHIPHSPTHTLPDHCHPIPETLPPITPHPDTSAASELSTVGGLQQGIVGHSDLRQEERAVVVVAEHMENFDGGEEPLFGCHNTQNSCESLSVETAAAVSGCGSVTHLVLSDAFIPVFEELGEGPAQHWTGLQEQHPHTAPSQTAAEMALTTVMDNDAVGLPGLFEKNHSSPTVDPVVESHDQLAESLDAAVESHDPMEAGADTPSQERRKPPVRTRRGKLQMKPCITLRKLRTSVGDEVGLLPQEAEQPGPARTQRGPSHPQTSHTSPGPSHTHLDFSHTPHGPSHPTPDTISPPAPHPDILLEEPAAASDLPAAVELPQGVVGHLDLPLHEEGVVAGAEDKESSNGGNERSTPQSTSASLTRFGRAPRGFLSFLSGGSGAGQASRPIRHPSQKPLVNTSRTGRRRTTGDAVTEASVHKSPGSSSPTEDVRASTSLSMPSPKPANSRDPVSAKREFLCARPSGGEEEPTTVSEFHFQDIFTEVLESD